LIGRLEIMRLREQPRVALGAKFDIRRFHDRVLENGTVPLALIKAKIELDPRRRGMIGRPSARTPPCGLPGNGYTPPRAPRGGPRRP
jgi:hypothetical protein